MIDRTKSRKGFWSCRLTDILIINSIEEANRIVSKLKYNNPRVITLDEAKLYSSLVN